VKVVTVDLREYQRQVLNGAFVGEGHDLIVHMVLGLVGEAGEVADLVKKSQYEGRTLDRERVVEELGDVLWYLASLAGRLGVDLELLALENIEKLERRHPDLYKSSLLVPFPFRKQEGVA